MWVGVVILLNFVDGVCEEEECCYVFLVVFDLICYSYE